MPGKATAFSPFDLNGLGTVPPLGLTHSRDGADANEAHDAAGDDAAGDDANSVVADVLGLLNDPMMSFSLSEDEDDDDDGMNTLVGADVTDTPAISNRTADVRRVTLEVANQPAKRAAKPHEDTPRPTKVPKLGGTVDAAKALRSLDPNARKAANSLRSLSAKARIPVSIAEVAELTPSPRGGGGIGYKSAPKNDDKENMDDINSPISSPASFTAGPDLILGNGGHETEVRVYKRMGTSIVSRAWAEAKFPGDQIICGRIPITRFGLFWRGRQYYGHWSFAVGDLPDGETARIGKDVIDYLRRKELE